jgi:hypothetical protein
MRRTLSRTARDLYAAAYPVGPTTGSTALAAWMTNNERSAYDVAAHIQCTAVSVRAWASGRRVPTIELARRVERLAGIPIAAWVEIVPTAADGG